VTRRGIGLDASGRYLTRGRQLLCNLVSRTSRAEVCRRFGISKSHLSELASGRYLPSLDLAIAFERELAIPAVSWGEA
jgi:transcriptional regulator with XRE-family HTH domain